ncbi:MAG: Vitamin B12 transporter BtuB [Ignavibacteria bacterium]|nr:Vitamin B12 transporter BtuB [Ignavibacteria bacterium]
MIKKLFIVLFMIPALGISQTEDTLNKSKMDSLATMTFRLGEINITASREVDISATITKKNMESQNRFEVSRVLNILPGINLTASGPRNESMVSVRGFDLRAVPVYMDGIPVYVPYDGYVDLARFTTFDLSNIDVSKGFSSMLYGPNSLGGTINLVSLKPSKKLDFDGSFGIININGFRGNINVGSGYEKFYLQGSYSYLKSNSYKMSNEFKPHAHEDGGERENSYRSDQKVNIKIGWTPNKNHEFVICYINQKGKKGTPVYAGDDKLNSLYSKPRFWQWPSWNKEIYYLLSEIKLNEKNHIKSRLYFDSFKNSINSFDDSTYTTQNKPYAFQSWYNDYTYGGSLEYGTNIIPKNELKFSAHFKEDIHRENDLNEPVRHFEDITLSLALEDVYNISDKFVLIPGLSYNYRNNITAQDYNKSTNTITDFAKAEKNPALNYQLGAFYLIKEEHKIVGTISRKTRFATIKERYSYRMGTALPNPDLKPETSFNYDLTYAGRFLNKLTFKSSLFYSHITNAIINVSNVQPGKSQMQNTGSAEFMGIELSLNFDVMKYLNADLNYTYIERNNLANPSVLFTDVPYTKLFSTIQYKPLKQIGILGNIEYNSIRYSTSYGTKVPEYVIFGAIVTGQLWKYMSIEAGINNIFDKNYMLTEGYPEEGRNIFLTLRFFNY